MIYTTYFAKLKSLPDNVIPISICAKAPSWYKGLEYKKLAPKYDFFMKWKENHDNDYYIKCFNEQVLSKLNATEKNQISEIIYTPSEYDNTRFLLYMNDGNHIYINISKLDNLNYYSEIYPTLNGKKGTLYLDSGNHFEPF